MEREQLAQIANSILQGHEVPERLITRSLDILSQSRLKIPLKAKEEAARPYLCCMLAIEQLGDKYGFQEPRLKKLPVPPSVFKNLLEVCRKELTPDVRQSPKEQGSKAPSTDSAQTPTKKNVPKSFRQALQKTKGKNETDPTEKKIKVLCEKLGLAEATIDAINFGYKQYSSLVTDKWGLVLGLIHVVVCRVEPEKVDGLDDELLKLAPVSQGHERLYDWISWAQRIITGQTWVSNISTVPEPVPSLHGDLGQWRFPID